MKINLTFALRKTKNVQNQQLSSTFYENIIFCRIELLTIRVFLIVQKSP